MADHITIAEALLDRHKRNYRRAQTVLIACAIMLAFLLGMAVTYKRDMKIIDLRTNGSCHLTDANGNPAAMPEQWALGWAYVPEE